MRHLKNPFVTFIIGFAIAAAICAVPTHLLGEMNAILLRYGAFCEQCTPEQLKDMRLYAQNPDAYKMQPVGNSTSTVDYPGKHFGGGPLGYPTSSMPQK